MGVTNPSKPPGIKPTGITNPPKPTPPPPSTARRLATEPALIYWGLGYAAYLVGIAVTGYPVGIAAGAFGIGSLITLLALRARR